MKNRPTELATLSKQIADAWDRRNAMVEAGDKIGVLAMNEAMKILEDMYRTRYHQWQILGGTSDIPSLAFPFVDYKHADWLDGQRTMEDARY